MKILVVWDLDGTITKSMPWIVASYQHAAKVAGLPIPSEEQLKGFACGGLMDHIYELFGKEGEEGLALANAYRKYYVENCLDRVELFEGFPQVFEELKQSGCVQAIATMKLESAAQRVVSNLGISDYFIKVAGDSPEGNVTKPDMIRACMATGDYDKVIMIGDCPSDMKAAKKAGVDFLAAAFGYGYSVEKCKADGIPYAEHSSDIPKMVMQ